MKRMHTAAVWMALGLGLGLVPALSQAQGQPAYVSRDANLRAGPEREFPLVAHLREGFPIAVYGCIEDFSWCDVVAGETRGWLWAGSIVYPYQGNYVPLVDYAPYLGIGILGFALNDYWGNNYRGRPFYRERDGWNKRYGPSYWERRHDRADRADRPNRPDRPRGDRPDRPDRPGIDRPVRPNPPGQVGGSGWEPPPGFNRPGRPQVQAVPQPPQVQAPAQGGGSGWEPPAGAIRKAPAQQAQQPRQAREPEQPKPKPQRQPAPAQGGGSGWTPGQQGSGSN
ncbi:MAG: SH3 domain-containing protein [Ramlibacter sp.]